MSAVCLPSERIGGNPKLRLGSRMRPGQVWSLVGPRRPIAPARSPTRKPRQARATYYPFRARSCRFVRASVVSCALVSFRARSCRFVRASVVSCAPLPGGLSISVATFLTTTWSRIKSRRNCVISVRQAANKVRYRSIRCPSTARNPRRFGRSTEWKKIRDDSCNAQLEQKIW
jgi:hypothetical protein